MDTKNINKNMNGTTNLTATTDEYVSLEELLERGEIVSYPVKPEFKDYIPRVYQLYWVIQNYKKVSNVNLNGYKNLTEFLFDPTNTGRLEHLSRIGITDETLTDKTFDRILHLEKIDNDFIRNVTDSPEFQIIWKEIHLVQTYPRFIDCVKRVLAKYIEQAVKNGTLPQRIKPISLYSKHPKHLRVFGIDSNVIPQSRFRNFLNQKKKIDYEVSQAILSSPKFNELMAEYDIQINRDFMPLQRWVNYLAFDRVDSKIFELMMEVDNKA